MSRQANYRVRGGTSVLVGLAGTYWPWLHAQRTGSYPLFAAMLGPLIACLGLSLLLHGPASPPSSLRGYRAVYWLVGLAASGINLFLLGFFDSRVTDPVQRIALAIGLALGFAYGLWSLVRG